MVDIVQTPANVQQGADAVLEQIVFGATVVQGDTLYKDPADNKHKPADANLSAVAAATAGISLSAGVNGQPGVIQKAGLINPGGAVVPGTVYVQSANAGKIAPAADLVAGHNVTVLGVGVSPSQIRIPASGPFVSGGVV